MEPFDRADLPWVKLYVRPGTLAEMAERVRSGDPAAGHAAFGDKPYFPALLLADDGTPQRGEVCLRGVMPWHHDANKPSLRFKRKKTDWYGGDRDVELSRPEDALALKNWLPQQLAAALSLMTDASEHVRVAINDRPYGVYLRSLRHGEPLALASRRMPGTFFKGDFATDLWQTPVAWNIVGDDVNADVEVFARFLRLLHAPATARTLAAVSEVLDVELYARWSALMVATGSLHTDHVHNQAWFFTGNHGRLEPIPWDCNSFGIHATPDSPVHAIRDPIMMVLACDPRFVHRRNEWLAHLLREVGARDAVVALIDAHMQRARHALAADRQLGDIRWLPDAGAWTFVLNTDLDRARDELVAWIDARYAFLHQHLDDARVVVEPGAEPGHSRVHVVGAVAVRALRAANGDAVRTPGCGDGVLFPGLSAELSSTTNALGIGVLAAAPVPLTYVVHAAADELKFVNAVTGADARVLPPPAPAPTATRTVHPSEFAPAPVGDVVLGPGRVDLADDLFVAAGQRLLVQPGTDIHLAAGKSIYCEGVLRAEGTAAAPIRLLPRDAAPWGTLGIAGPAADGALLAHVHVSGGSTGSLRARRFKGMVNAYECPRITLRACSFGVNHHGDDAVNLVQGEVLVEDCTWQDARADALDLDMCRGVVRRCRFTGSGNDALDLMACRVVVEDCTMAGSGDKGISVGEDTELLARACTFTGCNLGTEVKDASRALYARCRFLGNRIAVHAYQKKQIYPYGGNLCLVDCTLANGRDADLHLEERTAAVLVRTEVTRVTGVHGRVRVAPEIPPDFGTLLAARR
jgi:hypothetical protein